MTHQAVPIIKVPTRVLVLATISESLALRGRGPTIREIGQTLGLSHQPIYRHLQTLRAQGLVTWDANRKGTIRLGWAAKGKP